MRSLCVLPTKICDQLSVSFSQEGILEIGWVGVQGGCTRGSCGREREKGTGVHGWWLGSRVLHRLVSDLVSFFDMELFRGIAVTI